MRASCCGLTAVSFTATETRIMTGEKLRLLSLTELLDVRNSAPGGRRRHAHTDRSLTAGAPPPSDIMQIVTPLLSVQVQVAGSLIPPVASSVVEEVLEHRLATTPVNRCRMLK